MSEEKVGYTTADIKALEKAVVNLEVALNYIPDFVKEMSAFTTKLGCIDEELTKLTGGMIAVNAILIGKASDVEVACVNRYAKISIALVVILSIIVLWGFREGRNGRTGMGNDSSITEKRGIPCNHGSFEGGPGDRERNILPTEI